MANMSGKSRYPLDALLILMAENAAVVTADTDLPVQKLVSSGAYWQSPADVRNGEVALIVKAGTIGGAMTAQIDIYTATDAAKTGAKLYASFPIDSLGTAEIELDEISMLKRHPAATYWYATLNVGGTSPSIDFFAYLSSPSPL